MKKLIIASTSTVYKGTYLGYLQQELEILFRDAQEVLSGLQDGDEVGILIKPKKKKRGRRR